MGGGVVVGGGGEGGGGVDEGGRRVMRCFTADGVGGGEGVSQRELGLGRDRCKH